MTTIKKFVTFWGFEVDSKALDEADKKLGRVQARANLAGKAATGAFEKPRDALGKFVKYRDSLFAGGSIGGGSGGILGGYQESLGLIKESAFSARNAVLGLAASFAVGGVGLAGFFKLIGGFEQTEIAFDTLIGDAELAKKTLADLKQFAKSTPFNFGDVADLSKRLLAFSFTAEELIPTMKALGNIAAGVGKEKLPQLILALGQVKAAGKLRGSELRQFTEAGVPLIAELAKTLGVADSKIQQMVESGKVGFKDVYKALENVSGEGGRFNNLMARQSTSLLGIVSNIVDTIQLLAVDLGNRGLLGKAKQFTRNILNTLEAHREKILDGMQHAIELLVTAMENIIIVAKGVGQVFGGVAQVFGGTRRSLDLMLKALLVITSARMLFLLGKMGVGIAGLATSFIGLGNAALIAQFKIAAFAIGIGVAIAGVLLIIEDIVAYFQGRKSITGLILKDIGGLSAGFAKLLDPVFAKLKDFGKSVGVSIIDGMKALTAADWSQVGEVLLQGLEMLLIASTIPLRIGLTIAEGILLGLKEGIKTSFPKWAPLVDLMSGDTSGLDKSKAITSFPKPEENPLWSLLKDASRLGSGRNAPIYPGALSGIAAPAAAGAGAGQPVFNIQAPITFTVPASTPPESVGPAITEGFKQGLQPLLRETSRLTGKRIVY